MLSKGCLLLAAVCLLQPLLQPVEAFYDEQEFKALVYDDHSNDDAIYMTTEQLITRSKFEYSIYYTVANDGYITRHVAIRNTRARELRRPPVMLYHGANIDQTAYIISSSKQHFPEAYPRTQADGPITSFNRSIGFTLANNGFQVILMGQRGSNRANQGYTTDVEGTRRLIASGRFNLTAEYYDLVDNHPDQYWSYGLDEVIQFELRPQMDNISSLFNSSDVFMLTYSLSTPTTMAFLAANPEYARRVRVYVQWAPAIAADHFTSFDKLYFEDLCPSFPTRGVGFTPTYTVKPAVRQVVILSSISNELRYSIIYRIITALFGPSLRYHTNLERNLLAHVFMPVSFKSVQHYCQNSLTKTLTKFDYGPIENVRRYGQAKPPEYNISRLEVPIWVVVSGTYDGLADATTVQRLIEKTSTPKPPIHIIAPGFNHVDFIGAVQNDRYVVLPTANVMIANSN